MKPTKTQKLQEQVELLELEAKWRAENRHLAFHPLPPQAAFLAASATNRETALIAGNNCGKTTTGCVAMAYHLTGVYPDWWAGVRFDHPIRAWAASTTSQLTRDVMQSMLCGQYGVPSAFGTGLIPAAAFAAKPTMGRGIPDAYDTIFVTHRTNGVEDGVSTLGFKSYEQQREKFQGQTLDLGHCDEEPPMDVYSEFLARIRRTDKARMMVTLTPLQGPTEFYHRFADGAPDIFLTTMSLDEATFHSEELKRQLVAGYPAHERESRRHGVPLLGSGRVFQYGEETIKEPFLEYVPEHWTKLWGIDFGISHPFAAVLTLWDRDNDVIHVHQALRFRDDGSNPTLSQPMFHAQQMKQFGASVPVAYPHDGNQREKGSGATLASIYRGYELAMMPTHATFEDGGYSTEAGVKEMDERMARGALKVSAHLSEWFEEFRNYHRSHGLLVKKNDDLMSATRIAIMAKRFGRPVKLGNFIYRRRSRQPDFAPDYGQRGPFEFLYKGRA